MESNEEGMTETKPVILLDGSNIAYCGGQYKAPVLSMIELVEHTIREEGFETITMVDAAWRHTIDRPKDLDDHIKNGDYHQTPAKTSADDFLMHLALRMHRNNEDAYILTNDTFPVKREKGIIRRITFLIVPIKDREEILFNPPLDALLSQESEIVSAEEPKSSAPAPEARGDIDRLLMDSVYNFIAQMEPPALVGTRIPFSSMANYLHNLFDGDFATRFGYAKPKDFALDLSEKGMVKLVQEGTPLFLELGERLIEETERFEQGFNNDKEVIQVSGEEMDYLRAVFESLERECHFATEDKIAVKLRNLFPDTGIEAEPLIRKALDAKVIIRDKWRKKNVYWPADRRWEATHPDDYHDPYPEQLWSDFVLAIHRLPSSEQLYQTRYHMAKNLADTGVESIVNLPQSKREHMIQLAVGKRILDTDFTEKGIRISVKMDNGSK